MSRAPAWHLGAACAIAALAAALYLPFLGNPLVFDDKIFFNGRLFSYYATHPLGFDLRLPAYFSLAMTEVLWNSVAAQRIVSLVLHATCALALYRLLFDLQRAALGPQAEADAGLRAALGAAAFALHPVAVYGAAYLVQRSIVLATLFSLLSAVLFLRGLRRGSHADALSAALLFSLAVLSKEHAILLPAAALPLLALAGPGRRFGLRHAAIYLAACAPAASFVALRSLGVIGGVYEEAFGAIAAQIESSSGGDISGQPLALSAVTQAGLFFRYLALWFWPHTGAMAIDLRVDFMATWSPAWIAFKVFAFIACAGAGLALLLRRGAAGMAGFGLLWFWVLFLVEFSAARFQEPFVLYRSYLWGPGAACVAVALLTRLPRLPALAAELVRLNVDIIVAAGGNSTASATKQATQTIPVVMTNVTDPVGFGFIASLARPGANITGLTAISSDLGGKRLELLQETFPKAARIAVLLDPGDASKIVELKEIQAAAKALGVKLQVIEVRNPSDFQGAFKAAAKERAGALLVLQSAVTNTGRKTIVELATKNRLPTMWAESGLMDSGGLMSYGPNYGDLFRRAATFVDKILKGTKPADLPVEQPMKFEFVINLNAAKQIGLTVPPNVLARADRVLK